MNARSILRFWPIALVVVAFVAYALFVWTFFGPYERGNEEHGGVFGDAFGLITALFNGLAFAGLLIAISLQRDDLSLQREELRLQRQELAETRSVMEKQEAQLRATAESAKRQLFESTFFALLGSFQRYVEGIKAHGQPERGRDALGTYVGNMLAVENGAIRGAIKRDDAVHVYRKWLDSNEHTIRPYGDLLLSLFDFIENGDRPDKEFYFGLVRSTLSPREKTLLFYHALSVPENAGLKNHIERYALFRDVDIGKLTGQQVKERGDWYDAGAYFPDVAAHHRETQAWLAEVSRAQRAEADGPA